MESRKETANTTQELLKKAFIDLYLKKPLHKISINELTSACHISRGTFYLYYTNIQQLLESIEEDFLKDIMTLNSAVILEALKRNPDPSTYITDNKQTFCALLNGSESLSLPCLRLTGGFPRTTTASPAPSTPVAWSVSSKPG